MSIQIKDFGKTTAGQPVKVGILANDTIEVHILSYGATIQQLLVPDRKGNKVDVVLGYPTVQDYELNTCFLGAVVGRYANRIGGSKFTLYEEEYHVTPNEGKNCLHSGLHGFDKTVFDMGFEGDDTLVLTAASPDGTDGFPGNAELEVRYSLAGTGLMIPAACWGTVCLWLHRPIWKRMPVPSPPGARSLWQAPRWTLPRKRPLAAISTPITRP